MQMPHHPFQKQVQALEATLNQPPTKDNARQPKTCQFFPLPDPTRDHISQTQQRPVKGIHLNQLNHHIREASNQGNTIRV